VVQSERIDETAAGRTSLHKELLQVAQRDTRFGCYLARKVWWHLYVRDERLACRKCAALDYRSRHVRRRGLNRARRLRQKLGAPAGLLGPIPPKPPRWRRDHWTRTVAELAVAEGRIAGMLHAMIPRVRRRLKHD